MSPPLSPFQTHLPRNQLTQSPTSRAGAAEAPAPVYTPNPVNGLFPNGTDSRGGPARAVITEVAGVIPGGANGAQPGGAATTGGVTGAQPASSGAAMAQVAFTGAFGLSALVAALLL